jgi:hypothetical protein
MEHLTLCWSPNIAQSAQMAVLQRTETNATDAPSTGACRRHCLVEAKHYRPCCEACLHVRQ